MQFTSREIHRKVEVVIRSDLGSLDVITYLHNVYPHEERYHGACLHMQIRKCHSK